MSEHPIWNLFNRTHKRILKHLEPQDNGCILWVGPHRRSTSLRQLSDFKAAMVASPSPIMFFLGRRYSPRRFMWEVTNRELMDPNINLITSCSQVSCVNPDHAILKARSIK